MLHLRGSVRGQAGREGCGRDCKALNAMHSLRLSSIVAHVENSHVCTAYWSKWIRLLLAEGHSQSSSKAKKIKISEYL